MNLPKTVFVKGLDAVGRQWLKNSTPVSSSLFQPHITRELVATAEALMVAPRVSFKVYGENVVLPMLIAGFGLEHVTEMLEKRVIEFVQWRPLIAQSDLTQEVVVDTLKQVVNPIVAGHATNAEYVDPEKAIANGLSKWGQSLHLGRPVRRRLTDLAAKRTRLLAQESSVFAVNRVTTAYLNGELMEEGFDPNVPLNTIDAPRLHRLAIMAANLVEVGALIQNDYDLYQGADTWQALESLCTRVNAFNALHTATENVLTYERLVSIPKLLADGVVSLRDIPTLRERTEAKDYRDWLWSQPDPLNTEEVGKAYLDALTPRKAVSERQWFRPAHLTITQGISFIMGILMGPWGLAAGTLSSAGLAIADDAIINRLSHAPNPRRFATDLLGPLQTQATARVQGGQPVRSLEAQVAPLTWASAVLPQAAIQLQRASDDLSQEIIIPVNYRVAQVEA